MHNILHIFQSIEGMKSFAYDYAVKERRKNLSCKLDVETRTRRAYPILHTVPIRTIFERRFCLEVIFVVIE